MQLLLLAVLLVACVITIYAATTLVPAAAVALPAPQQPVHFRRPLGLGRGRVGIPQVVHYIWPNKEFKFDLDHQLEQSETRKWVAAVATLNPRWEVFVWTDAELDTLVATHFPRFHPLWRRLRPQLKRWDAVRPAILYVHGGIYLDHDINCRGDTGLFSGLLTPSTTRLLIRDPAVQSLNPHWHDQRTHTNMNACILGTCSVSPCSEPALHL
jgi:hypothetical protein